MRILLMVAILSGALSCTSDKAPKGSTISEKKIEQVPEEQPPVTPKKAATPTQNTLAVTYVVPHADIDLDNRGMALHGCLMELWSVARKHPDASRLEFTIKVANTDNYGNRIEDLVGTVRFSKAELDEIRKYVDATRFASFTEKPIGEDKIMNAFKKSDYSSLW